MEETVKAVDVRPPKVRKLATLAALLMILGVIIPLSYSPYMGFLFNFPTLSWVFLALGWGVLWLIASDPVTKIGIYAMIGWHVLMMFCAPYIAYAFSACDYVISLLLYLIYVYCWSILLRHKRMDIVTRSWCMVAVITYLFKMETIRGITLLCDYRFELYVVSDIFAAVLILLSVIAYWKIRRCALFSGDSDAASTPVTFDDLSPINKYVAAVVITFFLGILCSYLLSLIEFRYIF